MNVWWINCCQINFHFTANKLSTKDPGFAIFTILTRFNNQSQKSKNSYRPLMGIICVKVENVYARVKYQQIGKEIDRVNLNNDMSNWSCLKVKTNTTNELKCRMPIKVKKELSCRAWVLQHFDVCFYVKMLWNCKHEFDQKYWISSNKVITTVLFKKGL